MMKLDQKKQAHFFLPLFGTCTSACACTSIFLFLFYSCTNLQHATNINIEDLKNLRNDPQYTRELDQKIVELKKEDLTSKSCVFLGDILGKDNLIDQGKKFSLLYLKEAAKDLEGNAVLIEEVVQVGDYGYESRGKAYKCTSLKS